MTKRILVVDNEPAIQEVAQICLETIAGWEVVTANSGYECLDKAATYQPDAILLDVMMPEMDGITTFHKLQENPVTQAIPVIFLTAQAQSSDRQKFMQLGVKAAIAKPFHPIELATQVAHALGWELEM